MGTAPDTHQGTARGTQKDTKRDTCVATSVVALKGTHKGTAVGTPKKQGIIFDFSDYAFFFGGSHTSGNNPRHSTWYVRGYTYGDISGYTYFLPYRTQSRTLRFASSTLLWSKSIYMSVTVLLPCPSAWAIVSRGMSREAAIVAHE